MKCVKTQDEANALSLTQIIKRLMSFEDEMNCSVERLSEEELQKLPLLPNGGPNVLKANLKKLTKEEFNSVDYYLSSLLSIIKGILRKNKEPYLDYLFCLGHAYDTFAFVSPKRGYQKALMLWEWQRKKFQGYCPPLPKEVQDGEINTPISLAFGGKSEDETVGDITRLLERVIQQSQANKDEKLFSKATALLAIIKETVAAHERKMSIVKAEDEEKWKKMTPEERFLTKVAQRMKGSNYKVVVKSDHLLLKPNVPDFHYSRTLLLLYTKSAANEVRLNFGDKKITPITSTTAEGYIRIDFILK